MKWIAHYNDGTTLAQYNEDGSENRYQDINRDKLIAFTLWNDNKLSLALHLQPGQRLIYRKRVEKKSGEPDIMVYLAGWQQTVNGENVQSIAYVTQGGEIHLAGAFKEDHPWFYSPEFLDFEQ
jgi:hypothetical protein